MNRGIFPVGDSIPGGSVDYGLVTVEDLSLLSLVYLDVNWHMSLFHTERESYLDRQLSIVLSASKNERDELDPEIVEFMNKLELSTAFLRLCRIGAFGEYYQSRSKIAFISSIEGQKIACVVKIEEWETSKSKRREGMLFVCKTIDWSESRAESNMSGFIIPEEITTTMIMEQLSIQRMNQKNLQMKEEKRKEN